MTQAHRSGAGLSGHYVGDCNGGQGGNAADEPSGYVVQAVSGVLLVLAIAAHWHIRNHPSLPEVTDFGTLMQQYLPIYFVGEELLLVLLQAIFLAGLTIPWYLRMKYRVDRRDASPIPSRKSEPRKPRSGRVFLFLLLAPFVYLGINIVLESNRLGDVLLLSQSTSSYTEFMSAGETDAGIRSKGLFWIHAAGKADGNAELAAQAFIEGVRHTRGRELAGVLQAATEWESDSPALADHPSWAEVERCRSDAPDDFSIESFGMFDLILSLIWPWHGYSCSG